MTYSHYRNVKSYLPRGLRVVGLVCLLVGLSLSSSQLVGQEKVNLDIQSDHSHYDRNLGIATATGDVIVKYGNVTIEADQIEFHQSTGKIFARDNVRIFKDGEVISAEEIIYNVHTEELVTSDFQSSLEPLFITSDNIVTPEEGSGDPIILHDSTFTTHDSATPQFHVRVKKLKVYPDDKVVMQGAKVYAGNIPVFWFPYFVQPLEEELGYYFTPGWNTAWGAFLLNQYGFMINDDILAKAHLDVRSERGLATGVEFKSRKFKSNPNIGRLNLYYGHDDNPQLSFNGRQRRTPTTSDRYRVNLQHRVFFPGSSDETFYLDFDINKLSDPFFYEDFFPNEYRLDPRPDNLINLVKVFEQGEVSLTGRFQLNDFFHTDTKSPELAIDIIRTPIGSTGFFYDGMTTYGLIDEELSDADRLAGAIDPSGYNRFQTYHEFLFPTQLGGFLNLVPRAGVGYANYSNFDTPAIDSFDRKTTHLGMDVSFKLSKSSPDVYHKGLGIDGLLHVVKPYLNYSLTNTNHVDGRFSPVDRMTPTTRLRPIDMPLFTAVDEIRDWHIVRTGVSNSWFTKRNGQSHQWLMINNYIDLYLEDPELNRDTSNFFTQIEWTPVHWLSASTTAQLPLFDKTMDFTEVTTSLNFMPTDWFTFGLTHYFLDDHPYFGNTDLYALTTYTRLSDQWGFSTSHRFESDDNTLEYQQYMVHRDLGAWTASAGGIVRDNRRGENEYGLLFSLTLKAFPQVTMPVDFQPNGLGAE